VEKNQSCATTRPAGRLPPEQWRQCAFTVAWERPNQFSKVIPWTGSYTNIAAGNNLRSGGHNHKALVRRVVKKPIRVILQDGS
jgi:enterochelin esterase family protein